jgi:broad specificity phosphatase PhoE
MTVRLTLLCAAAGTAAREERFGDDPADERGLRHAKAAAATLPQATRHYAAPSVRCRQTAEALGLAAEAAPALRDADMGAWRGRTLNHVTAADPDGLAAWLTDPAAAPHGGESISELCRRIGAWLDALPADAGRVLAVAGPGAVRAAAVHALSAPHQAFWRIDVPPLSTLRLTGRLGRWNLRLGPHLGPPPTDAAAPPGD